MMKLPYELQPGDRFYYRHSVGEDVKLWKVVATGLNSLIATSEHVMNVPLYYDQMAEPDRHFCYVPSQPGFFESLFGSFHPSAGNREREAA
jgi:hypothetical protein